MELRLSDRTVNKIQRHRVAPKYAALLKEMSSNFNVKIFTEEMYEVGRGGFGRCYLGKICSEKG
jgi:hypothetical protein